MLNVTKPKETLGKMETAEKAVMAEKDDWKMTNVSLEYKHRELPTDVDVENMLKAADKIEDEYFRLRAKALVALFKKFGKRRKELQLIQMNDIKVEGDLLLITFNLAKKRKLGLFQYFKFLKKTNPEELNKPQTELVEQWKLWRETKEGSHFREDRRTKSVSIEDKYAKLILEYYEFMKNKYPDSKWLFPSGKSIFGTAYVIFPERHLKGWELWHIIKQLDPQVWCHLFRELKGSEVVKEKGETLESLFSVKRTLDLSNIDVAYKYVDRYAIQKMKTEA